jgi:alkylation response protein AidB-like acyl-CoA dehydrogenase
MTAGLIPALSEFLSDHRPGAAGDIGEGRLLRREWWQRLCAFGAFALPLPEASGGLGLGIEDTSRAFEQLGEALSPGPLVWNQLAAYDVAGVVDGEVLVTGLDTVALAPGDPMLVPYLEFADAVLVLSAEDVRLYDVSGIEALQADSCLDPGTPFSQITSLGDGKLLGDAGHAASLRRIGTLLTAAVQVGVSQTALQVAVDYANGREQFGRPIGSFQALKHLLADCYVRTNLARAAVYAAAELEDELSVAEAKLLAGDAADRNARTAVQVFGGMGFTWETAPHWLLKRAWVLENDFGTQAAHAATVAEHALVASGSAAGAR